MRSLNTRATGNVSIWTAGLALVFYGVFNLQLIRSLDIDMYQSAATRIDIFGYWLAALTTLFLGAKSAFTRPALLLAWLLIAYTSLIFLLTDVHTSIEAFALSRHGIIMWYILGIGAGSTIRVFVRMEEGHRKRRLRLILSCIAFVAIFQASYIGLQYTTSLTPTESYQAAATTGMVLLMINFLALEAIWGKSLPVFFYFILALGAISVIAGVALAQSTMIVLFGIFYLILLGWKIYKNSKRKILNTLLFIGLFVAVIVFNQERIQLVIHMTRFAELLIVQDAFSPLDNRLQLLTTFDSQFRVSPLFGHFNAESLSSAGAGLYIHSLPLSFLTHTGIAGFLIFCTCVTVSLRSRLRRWGNLSDTERNITYVLVGVLAIGTLSTFLTWPVFWFMLGVTTLKPSFTVNRR